MKKHSLILVTLCATTSAYPAQPSQLETQSMDRLSELLNMKVTQANELFGYFNDREAHENKQRKNEQREFVEFITERLKKKDQSERFWQETLDAAVKLFEKHIAARESTARKGKTKIDQINNQHRANLNAFKQRLPKR